MSEEIYAPIIDTEMTLTDALRQTSRIAKGNNTLKRGFRQVTKSIIRNQAKIVLLAKDFPDNMGKIVIGLGRQFNVPVIKIESAEELGRIVGFERIKDEEVVKVSKCGTAAIIDFVEESEGRYFIENALRDKINE